jgi:hypothetical protein
MGKIVYGFRLAGRCTGGNGRREVRDSRRWGNYRTSDGRGGAREIGFRIFNCASRGCGNSEGYQKGYEEMQHEIMVVLAAPRLKHGSRAYYKEKMERTKSAKPPSMNAENEEMEKLGNARMNYPIEDKWWLVLRHATIYSRSGDHC